MRRSLLFLLLWLTLLAGCGTRAERDPRIAEILSAPVPSGVDKETWRQLTRELAHIVASNPRTASTPPTNLASATTLEYDNNLGVLKWPYYFSGDYDQNGVVSVSDLTPLAIHLGENVTDANSTVGVCDGDGNLAVTVADLTPIGVNLGKHVEGYRVYSADSEAPYPTSAGAANGSGATLAGSVLLSEASGDKSSQRLSFSFDIPAPATDTYYWVRPYDAADDGTPSNNLLVNAGATQNLPPVARLVATSLGSATPLKVSLSAQTSSDDHGIVKYEWDLDGNGVYEYDSGTNSITSTWFYGAGTFDVGVRVSDAEDLRSTKTAEVEVSEGATWHTQMVDAQGQGARLLNANDRPAIIYNQLTPSPEDTQQLVYRRATSKLGTGWGTPVVLGPDPVNRAFDASSIGGKPACVMNLVDLTHSNRPHFQLASDTSGTFWSAAVPVDPVPQVNYGTIYSLAEVSGSPAVAYYHALGGLVFERASDAAGLTWPQETVVVGGRIGDLDLAVVNGRPAVAYQNPDYGHLFYVAATDFAGTIWDVPRLADGLTDAGQKAQLFAMAGLPTIVYYDAEYRAVRLVRAEDADGKLWSSPIFLAFNTELALGAEQLIDGRLGVLFVASAGSELRFIASNDSAGASWSRPVSIESNVANDIALTFVGDQPCVCSFVPEQGDQYMPLRFAGYY